MIRLYHFLGGITFAIFLIVTSAIFVIIGTLIESKTGSHLYAASLTYQNPLFTLLICGFFINILFSATRRFPFKKKHIPFLITHLGMLMILSGNILKNVYGTQGHMSLIEGSGSDYILLPNTHALYVENKSGSKEFALNEKTKQFDDLTIQITGYQPNSSEKLQTWIKGDYAFIYGIAPFPIGEKVIAKLHPDYPEFEILAIRSLSNKTVEEIAKEYEKPLLLLFIEDSEETISVFLYDKDGRLSSESFKKGNLKSAVAYDKGFFGYAVEFKAPLFFGSKEKKLEKLKNILNQNIESLSPPLELLKLAAEKEKKNFTDILVSYLQEEATAKEMIYTGNFELPKLDLQKVPLQEYNACCLIAALFPVLEKKQEQGEDIHQFLEKTNWPFAKNLILPASQIFDKLVEQIYSLGESLPNLPIPSEKAFFSAYLRLYQIDLNSALNQIEDEPVFLNIETPLTAKREKAERLQKIEDEKPIVYLELNGKERLALTFDNSDKGLKWPAVNGKFLLRFQPLSQTIPYRIRLQNARKISYPNSSSNFSFEADLIVMDQAKKTTNATISMNHVYETWDGYRFYLSNITPGIEGEVQRIEIIVSHDPTKYILTYPGAFILALGIILVFWFMHYFK